jgi:transposase
VEQVSFEAQALVVAIRPRWRLPRCGECGWLAPGYDRARTRRWRHLNVGALRFELEYRPRRVNCVRCGGIRVERVSWAAHGSGFTWAFEELAAYLAQMTDQTHVTRLMGIAWVSVGRIVGRVVDRKLPPERLDGLRRIGVDEFGYRRRHRYLTVVVDHDRRRVVWAEKGRSAATLGHFFDELGAERRAQLEWISIDMAAGYIKAIEERVPQARIVFDRFHVQRLASDALDEVRRSEMRRLHGAPEGAHLFHSRFALLKNPWNLSGTERTKLSDLQRSNAALYRAYLLKESLAKCLDYRQPGRAERSLRAWLRWAGRSRLKPFVRAARTIRKYLHGILAYIRDRLTNAVVEGINNRLRMIARRAFGFHSHYPLISMLFLCCGGIELSPPLPGPTQR